MLLGGSGESIYFTYSITGPWDDSGAGEVASGSFSTQITSGISIKIDGVSIVSSNEGIAYSTVSVSGLTPVLTNSPPYRFRINQSLNTYTNQYLNSSFN